MDRYCEELLQHAEDLRQKILAEEELVHQSAEAAKQMAEKAARDPCRFEASVVSTTGQYVFPKEVSMK